MSSNNNVSEASIQRDVINWLLKRDWAVIRINALQVAGIRSYIVYPALGSEGISDLIVLKGNRTLFIEIKTAQGVVEKSQMRFYRWCQEMGLNYHIIRSIEQLSLIIGADE